jgi:phosphohistidine swiveling domain-containing protein
MGEVVRGAGQAGMSSAAFPIAWSQAADAERPWTQERLHYPEPVAPLEFAVIEAFTTTGLTAAAAQFGLPLEARMCRLNGYVYQSTTPSISPGPELARRMRDAVEPLLAGADRLAEDWRERHLPEVRAHMRDVRGASADEILARARRLGEVHFLVVLPGLVATSSFLDLHARLFGDDASAHTLLGGFETLTLAGEQELWRLGEQVRADAVVRAALEAPDPIAELAGHPFAAALLGFLAEHGHRTDGRSGVGAPSWSEAPGALVKRLRGADREPGRDPGQERAARAAERDAVLERVRPRLPSGAREQYERLLAAAQTWAVLGEDHAHWIDLRAMGALRRALLAAGDELDLAEPADVLFLEPHELGDPPRDVRGVVVRRREEHERFAALDPPLVLGRFRPDPPPDGPVTRAIGRYLGTPPRASDASAEAITGNPGAPGRARGVARVLCDLDDAGRVSYGDVLVASTTSPAWTPLFGTIAAVVTEAGGVLSHAATVAREYGIPAVVGAAGATTRIPDGRRVDVDGAAGRVRLL